MGGTRFINFLEEKIFIFWDFY
jgi:hypothetical protein